MRSEFWFLMMIALWCSGTALAYPQFIAHGYNTCLTCHFNPVGGGPLNDYGRALGSNTISGRAFVPKDMSEDELAKYSGFFFKQSKSAIKPYANIRGLYLTNQFRRDNSESEYIPMEAKVGLTTQWGKDKSFIFSGSISYNPGRSDNDVEDKWRSREHFLGYRSKKGWGVYAGLLDKAFGLRIPDHNAYSKSTNNLGQDDQSHGVLFNYLQDKWNVNVHAFVGNMTQDAELRQVGGSARFEYNFSKTAVIGASILNSSSDFLDQSIYALHAKFAPGKLTSLMAEVGKGAKTSAVNTNEQSSTYFWSQHHIRIMRGLYYFTTLEYFDEDSTDDKTIRFGPGIQYFPVQKIELRVEILNSRIFSDQNSLPDALDLLAQVHIWL